MASVQVRANKNGNFIVSGKDIYKTSTHFGTFSPEEVFAIVKLWQKGAFAIRSIDEKSFKIGSLTPDKVDDFLSMEDEDPKEVECMKTCSASKTTNGNQCSRPATGDDGLCTQHRKIKCGK